jgi:Fe2+ transport system protein FeoA
VNEVSLTTLAPGEEALVERVGSDTTNFRQRLLEMGIIKGTQIELVRYAPLGDPIEVRVRGYRLSMRRGEAATVFVRKKSA